ncbi:MAG: ABC transporter permease [Terriglobales bacterium]
MSVAQDLRFGWRQIRKTPGVALIAMLALGLGIGANTAIFSVANGILLNPLPYHHLDRLMAIAEVPPHSPPDATNSVSAFNYAAWQQQAHAFRALAAYETDQVNLSGAGLPQMVMAAEVSANFFQLLPSRPLRGRTFLAGEDRPGHAREVILSQSLWQHQFAANANIVGQTIDLNQQAYTVVGILGKQATMPRRVFAARLRRRRRDRAGSGDAAGGSGGGCGRPSLPRCIDAREHARSQHRHCLRCCDAHGGGAAGADSGSDWRLRRDVVSGE